MSDDRDVFGVHIGAREVYDQLIGLREDVQTLVHQGRATTEQLADHEDRIRTIERWKYGVPTAVLASVASVAVALLTK